jgi:LCP family protein required for cell wall assembly
MNTAPPGLYARPQPPRRRRGSCGCWMVAFFLLIIPVFLCGMAFLLYVVFPPAPLDILVLGVDARPNEGYLTRTDSIMLVGVNPSRLQVSLLSIPRDLFVDVPGYGLQRINTVNVLGEQDEAGSGPALLSSAIADDFGIQMDRYVRLNFDAFVQLVDAVGGVTIDVPRTLIDYEYPTPDGGTIVVQFDPGVQAMDGERALAYARTRHADDDYARAARQQQVILALSSRLINPIHWPAAINILTRSVDTNMTLGDFLSIAPTVLVNAGRFDQLVIDRSLIASRDGAAVPNFAVLQPWIEDRFD